MSDNIDQKIENCKIKLLKKPLTFFGLISYGFEWYLEKNLPEHIEGYVSFNPNDLTQTVDKKIHINKSLLENNNYSYKNLCFLLLHEIQHIIRKHSLRGRRKENQNAWALACEHCVDRDTQKIAKAKSDKGVIIDDNYITGYLNEYAVIRDLDSIMPNCSEEEAYEWILKNQTKFKFENNSKFIKVIINEGNNESEIYITLPQIQQDDGNYIPINPITIDSDIETAIENTISEAVAITQSLQNNGSQPQSVSELLDKLIFVDVDWKMIVDKAIKKNVTRLPSNRNWRKLNKYYIPHNITLPGIISKKRNRGISDLYILLDNSASISSKDLKEFSGIVYDSMKYFEKTILIVHDVKIQTPQIFTKRQKNKFLEFLKSVGFKGRGGTSHLQCFKEIDRVYEAGENIGIVLSLTDGMSDIETCIPKVKWINDNKIPFIVICNSSYRFTTPNIRNLENFLTVYIN